MSPPSPEPQPDTKVLGTRRETLAELIVRRYSDNGETIRTIANDIARSYGFVHRVLTDSGVGLRPRGGTHLPPTTPEERKRSELARLRQRVAELEAQLGSCE
jgi:hypothetical protein